MNDKTPKEKKSIVKTSKEAYNKASRTSAKPKVQESPKAFGELTLADRFIFFNVMQDAVLCKQLLEIILGVEIERIEYLEGEKTIEVRPDSRGIRLDIYVKDAAGTVYNVEMQTSYASNLPKRSRYYQNLIDVDLLGRGEDYRLLNKSFVIFICMEDIFHKGRHIYTFENRCRQDTDLALEDGAVKIFLNPYSDMDDVTPELGNFLKYLAEGIATDEYTERLVDAVEAAKRDPRLMVEYMSYYAEQADRRAEREESHAEGFEEGIEQGIEKGIEKGLGILVRTLKSRLSDFESVYRAVIENEEYADYTREEVMKYY